MKIAIVGGGFTGLACALSLLESGVEVVLYEKKGYLGGLAGGVKEEGWKWSLEYFYHHVFTNDRDVLRLAKKVGATVLIKKPKTTSFLKGKEIRLDSPISVLQFSELGIFERLRMGLGLALLKLIPRGVFLERYKAVDVLPCLLGKAGYQTVWERLLLAKFGPYAGEVNMAWFWARVAKRTKNLGYFEDGFQDLVDKTRDRIEKLGGKVFLGKKIERVVKNKEEKWVIGETVFDGIVMTTPALVTEKILGKVYFPKIKYLWAQTVILELNRKLINGYWLSILERDWPFLVAVEQTNMIDKKYYGNNRVVYLGNYLPESDKQLTMSDDGLVSLYLPYLRKINKLFRKKWIKSVFVFREPFAQPVFPVNYSKELVKVKSNSKGLYLANMSMVYPFDRGTNYAVRMGNEVAKKLVRDLK